MDIDFIRKNPELVAEKARQKGYPVDVLKIIDLDERRRELIKRADALRNERNTLAHRPNGSKPNTEDLQRGKDLKIELNEIDLQLKEAEDELSQALRKVPNMPLESVPVGNGEAENVVDKTVGEVPSFSFDPLSHQVIAEALGLMDKARAAKISGSRFVYLEGDLVKLQFAIINFVMSELTNPALIERLIKENNLNLKPKPFKPVLPPAMLKTAPYQASTRLDAEETTYKLEDDDLWLNASAEHTLCTMYMNEVIAEDELPYRLIGYSTSFRREAGSYGKDIEGILRMHQFDKIEMEVISTAATGEDEHSLLVAIQEYLVSSLGLPYQLMRKCTGDIGKPNASGFDINTWFPSQGTYRETHTADYLTDYQTRNLRIRTRSDDGTINLAHTNDATAFALGRILAAIIENYQDSEGHFAVPPVLIPFMAGQDKI